MTGTWRYALIRVDFSQECTTLGPLIKTSYNPFLSISVDEVSLDHADTTQARRLCMKIVQKAVVMSYRKVFGRKPDLYERVSHVSLLKIPPKLTVMIENVFTWYGCGDISPVYSMPFRVDSVTAIDIDRWKIGIMSADAVRTVGTVQPLAHAESRPCGCAHP
jgi:hypothetical protein